MGKMRNLCLVYFKEIIYLFIIYISLLCCSSRPLNSNMLSASNNDDYKQEIEIPDFSLNKTFKYSSLYGDKNRFLNKSVICNNCNKPNDISSTICLNCFILNKNSIYIIPLSFIVSHSTQISALNSSHWNCEYCYWNCKKISKNSIKEHICKTCMVPIFDIICQKCKKPNSPLLQKCETKNCNYVFNKKEKINPIEIFKKMNTNKKSNTKTCPVCETENLDIELVTCPECESDL